MKVKRRPTPAPHIPFISLADIAWQIIIFFLMASAFRQSDALKVDSPSSSPSATAAPDKLLTVSASEHALLVDGKPITIADLPGIITSRLAGHTKPEERVVIVEGSDDLSYQRDAEIMYLVQKAGGTPMIAEEK